MLVETKFGNFEIIKNHRESFELQPFEDRYVPQVFNRYDYIVGDVSSGILRLKGFFGNEKNSKSYLTIPDYLSETCHYNVSYYILKRVKKEKR